VEAVESEGVHQGGQVICPVTAAAGRIDRQRFGIAVAAQVRGDGVVLVAKGQHQVFVEHRGAAVAVQEHDRNRTGARLADVNLQPRGLNRASADLR